MTQEIVNMTLKEGVFCIMLIGVVAWVAKYFKEDKQNTNKVISEAYIIISKQGNIIQEQGLLIKEQSEVIKEQSNVIWQLHKVVEEQGNKLSNLTIAVEGLTKSIKEIKEIK